MNFDFNSMPVVKISYNSFIFGKDPTPGIVGCEVSDSKLTLWTQAPDGTVSEETRSYQHWILADKQVNSTYEPLAGNQHYKFIKRFRNKSDFWEERKLRRADYWMAYDDKESAMLLHGFTYFKDLKMSDVSILAFDIEATSLETGPDAKVLIISNTFRQGGQTERRMFCYDDYETEADMINAWCEWVQSKNPAIIAGHNLHTYDLPYLNFCASRGGTRLRLGRNNRPIEFNNFESKYRKDGSQFFSYTGIKIYGRELVDTWFLSMKYDIGRKYENYKLKQIIAQEGLEVPGRQHYDGSLIAENYKKPSEWEKIKKYAEHDADDALALWDLQAPSYFYLSNSVPKSLQQIINGASGSWLNSFLVRSYLQIGHSIPNASETFDFEGAISRGNPGIYKNIKKLDIASLYPSIILQYKIYDPAKDPNAHFLQMVEYFTAERLKHKKLGQTDRFYKDLEQSEKIFINSSYGLLGCPGLNFNSITNAELVTKHGREILTEGIQWAEQNSFIVANCDTDSISICRADQSEISADDQQRILDDINGLFPEKIRWADDGYYESMIILKAKNYSMRSNGKRKIKGSALKASQKESGLRAFQEDLINSLHDGKSNQLEIYNQYVSEILTLQDISRWSSKKSITSKVLNPSRSNESKVLDAIEDSDYQEGDKVYVYFAQDGSLKLQEHWNHDHDVDKLLEKLYKTVKIFETVLDVSQFPNYKLKRNKSLLQQLAA